LDDVNVEIIYDPAAIGRKGQPFLGPTMLRRHFHKVSARASGFRMEIVLRISVIYLDFSYKLPYMGIRPLNLVQMHGNLP